MLSSCNGPQGHAGQYAAGLGNCMAWERPGQTGIWNWRRLASNSTTAQPCQTLLPTGLPCSACTGAAGQSTPPAAGRSKPVRMTGDWHCRVTLGSSCAPKHTPSCDEARGATITCSYGSPSSTAPQEMEHLWDGFQLEGDFGCSSEAPEY